MLVAMMKKNANPTPQASRPPTGGDGEEVVYPRLRMLVGYGLAIALMVIS